VIALHDEQTMSLAVVMSRPPHEIDAMGYLDSLSFLDADLKRRTNDMHWQASLAGKRIR
jgi:hypothetical protein